MASIELSAYLNVSRIQIIDAKNKNEAIEQTLKLLETNPAIADFNEVRHAIWEREEALPTGIGLGIGVPHVRCHSVLTPVAALTVVPGGVAYGAMDGENVRIILMIAMPEGEHKLYLEYLSRATLLFMIKEFRDALLGCKTPEDIWQVIQTQSPLHARMR